MNFRKMQKRNLKCSLQCDNDETQVHMFEACTPILSRRDVPHTLRIQNIYMAILMNKGMQSRYSEI